MTSERENRAFRGPRSFKFGLQVDFWPPTLPPRGSAAPKAPRKSKFGLQVQFSMLYPSALEFLKSEVPYLRYDLREVLQLSEHLVNQNSVFRYTLDDLPIRFGIFEIGGLLPPI